jgi:hypothetical protein
VIPIVKRLSESARRIRIAKLVAETKETIARIDARIAEEKKHAPESSSKST